MFVKLLWDLMFFGVPAVLLIFLGVSIFRYVTAKRKNAKAPDTYSSREMKARETLLIVSAVLTGFFLAILIGLIMLLTMAIAHM